MSSETNRSLLSDYGLSSLPGDWDCPVIGDHLKADRGISVGVMYPGGNSPGGIPLIKAGDIRNNWINPRPDFSISTEKHQEYIRTELEGGELLISLVGNAGQTAVVPKEMSGWNAARAVAVLRLQDKVDPIYLQYCLQSPSIQLLMKSWCNTTVQETLNLKEIKKVPFPLPKKAEQIAIAHILGTLDEKIELNRKTNETLEGIAKALFKSWFVDFDPVRAKAEGRPTGLPDEISELFPDSFEESELGEIPSGWESSPLSDFITEVGKKIKPSSETASNPYVPIDCISSKTLMLQDYKEGDEAKSSLVSFKKGDILFGAMRPYFHKVCIAPFDGTTRTTCLVLNSKAKDYFGFSLLTLFQESTIEFATQNSTGSTIPYIKWMNELDSLTIAVPSVELATQFNNFLEPILEKFFHGIQERKVLSELRDILLPKLVSGELRVPDAEKILEEVGI